MVNIRKTKSPTPKQLQKADTAANNENDV